MVTCHESMSCDTSFELLLSGAGFSEVSQGCFDEEEKISMNSFQNSYFREIKNGILHNLPVRELLT